MLEIIFFTLKILCLVAAAFIVYSYVWDRYWNKHLTTLTPEGCPKSYQGVGDPACWKCVLQYRNCPYLCEEEREKRNT